MEQDNNFQSEKLNSRTSCRTYLATYSQADLTKVPSCKDFGRLVKNAFNRGSKQMKVLHWACSMKEHQDHGIHYHLSLKLSEVKRWKQVKDEIMKSHNIVLNFLDQLENYHSAYICKSNTQVCHSKHQPNLKDVGSLVIKKFTQALCAEHKHTQKISTNKTNESVAGS